MSMSASGDIPATGMPARSFSTVLSIASWFCSTVSMKDGRLSSQHWFTLDTIIGLDLPLVEEVHGRWEGEGAPHAPSPLEVREGGGRAERGWGRRTRVGGRRGSRDR